MREIIAREMNDPFIGYTTRAEAERDPDAVVVLSGDLGGTVFLTAPLRLVACSTATLRTLVSDLDAVTWMSGDPTNATVAIEHYAIGSHVWGGDGGGEVVEGVWTHADRLPDVVSEQARQVVLGSRPRIDGGVLRDCRRLELERKRLDREKLPIARTSMYPEGIPWDFDIAPPAVPFPAGYPER